MQDESIHQTRRPTEAESTGIPPKTVHTPLSSPKHHSLTTPHDSGVLEERLLPTWSYGTKLCSTPNNKNVCTVAEQISSIGHWRPSSLNLRHAVAVVGEGSFRLCVLSGGPPLSLFDICFLRQQGVQQLDVPLVFHPLGWFFCLLGCGSFHFVPFISPFLGALVLFMIGRVSSISSKAAIKPQSLSKEKTRP